MKESEKSCPTVCDPIDDIAHGILQARSQFKFGLFLTGYETLGLTFLSFSFLIFIRYNNAVQGWCEI